MNDREKIFGVEAIKTSEELGEKREGSVEVDSPEALMQFGEKIQEEVWVQNDKSKANTTAGLNEVVKHSFASGRISESTMSELLKPVNREIQESFGKVDRAAALAEQEIGQVARWVKSKELSQIADATPFVGGAKRVIESVAGKTLSGEDLSGKDRLKHGVGGAVDLGLDVAAVGAIKKGARLAYVSKEIIEGVKQNPEAVANLGIKIINGNEQTTKGSKDISLEKTSEENPERKNQEQNSGNIEYATEATQTKNDLIQHIGSQEYLNKLAIEFNGNLDEAKKCQQERIENLKQVKFEFLSLADMKGRFGKDDPKNSNVAGFYSSSEHKVFFAYDLNPYELNQVMIHEFIHASMRIDKNMSESAKKSLDDSYKNLTEEPAQEKNAYYKQSGERIARKQQLDLEMDKLGIKKYGEKFTDEHYEKLMESYKNGKFSRNAKEFIKTTKPEDLKKIFDEIAKQETNGGSLVEA
jgi:hypothetical protein